MIRYNTIILIALFCCFKNAVGQQKSTSFLEEIAAQKNIKVGLVLSGGGAKGFAHIGVLKVLEESGVHIDYIAGTSMGAVIGGLYASGYTASQIDSLVTHLNFDRLIQDNLPRKAKTFYERDNDERYAITLPFDHFKVGLPSGFSGGQNYYNLLSQLLYHVNDIKDFNNLPIPFLCAATNIETGEEVILDKGYLPDAINASAALPSVFSPVMFDDQILVDGGVANNYPVEELKKRGVDIIIGVDVQDDLRDRSELESLSGIMLQISNLRTIEAMKSKIALTDIYVKPDITDYGLIDFKKAKEITTKGIEAGLDYLDLFTAIATKQEDLPKKSTSKKPLSKDSISIDAVTFYGAKNYTRSYLKGKLKLRPPETISFTDFNQRINNLSGTGNFERIAYVFKPWNNGQLLEMQLQPSKNKQFLRLAAHYDDLFRTGVLLNYTHKRPLLKNDVLALDLILGDNIRYKINYYIDKGYYWSVGLRSTLDSFDQIVDTDILESTALENLNTLNRIDLKYTDLTNQLYLRTLFLRQFSLELGFEHKYLHVFTETILDQNDTSSNAFTFDNNHIYSTFGTLLYDSLDHKYFPTQGFFIESKINWYFSDSDFQQDFKGYAIAKATFKTPFQPLDKFTLIPEFSGGFLLGSNNASRSLLFLLGGYGNKKVNNITPFLGYDFLSLSAEDFLKFSLTFDFEIAPKSHINFIANYAQVEDRLFETGNWLNTPEFSGYALGYSFDSFLGPLEIKYAYSPETKQGNWFFNIGYSF